MTTRVRGSGLSAVMCEAIVTVSVQGFPLQQGMTPKPVGC